MLPWPGQWPRLWDNPVLPLRWPRPNNWISLVMPTALLIVRTTSVPTKHALQTQHSSQPANEIRVGRLIASASQMMRQLENEGGQAEGCIGAYEASTPSNADWGMNARPTQVIPTRGYRSQHRAVLHPQVSSVHSCHRTTRRTKS